MRVSLEKKRERSKRLLPLLLFVWTLFVCFVPVAALRPRPEPFEDAGWGSRGVSKNSR